MKILQLTLLIGKRIFVNFDLVTDFSEISENQTIICFGDEDYHFKVIEDPEEILERLNNIHEAYNK